MNIEDISGHLRTKLKDVRGREFFATVEVNNVLRTENDLSDYLLQINKNCFIRGGNAIVWDGRKFLLGTGYTENLGGPLMRTLRMITVTAELPWTRAAGTPDVLTGLTKETASTPLGTILVALQATSKNVDAFRIETSKFLLITNTPLTANDRVGPYVITFVEPRHDLFFCEAR